MTKKWKICLLFMFLSGTVKAQDLKYLIFEGANTTESVLLSEVQKLTFQNGKVQIHGKVNTTELELASLSRIFFSDVTAINNAASDHYTITSNSGEWTFSGGAKNMPATIYNMAGMPLKQFIVPAEGMQYETDKLQKGLYIIKYGKNTFKLLK